MEPTHGHRHGTFASVNRANIARLQEQRDRAGLTQLADVLDKSPHPEGPGLALEARVAVDWIDATAPRIVNVADAIEIRVGDILWCERDGYPLEGVVIDVDGHHITTNLGDNVAI